MIFKPWAEIPPPRHIIDDQEDVDYDENLPIPVFDCTFSIPLSSLINTRKAASANNTSNSPNRIIIVASRLVPLFREYQNNPVVSSITISSKQESQPNKSNKEQRSVEEDDGEYDEEDIPSSKNFHLQLSVYSISNTTSTSPTFLLPLAPHMPPAASVALSKQLTSAISALNTQSELEIDFEIVILATTNGASAGVNVGTLDRPLAYLQTSTNKNQQSLSSSSSTPNKSQTTQSVASLVSSTYPPLLPPLNLQGPSASLLSSSQLHNLPATAIIVAAEGPQDYEQVAIDGIHELSYFLKNGLGVEKVGKALAGQASRLYF